MTVKGLRQAIKQQHRIVQGAAIIALFVAVGFAAVHQTRAATYASNKEAEAGTLAGNQTSGDPTGASGGASVKFGAVSGGGSGGGGGSNTCTNPVEHGTDPSYGWTAANGYNVNNDAWSGSAQLQTLFVCNYNSWYATSNQPNIQGQVMTYPDTQVNLVPAAYQCTLPNCGPVIYNLTSVTSDYAMTVPADTNIGYDEAYDIWIDGLNTENNGCEELMVWNKWQNNLNGVDMAYTNQSIGGKTWNVWKYGDPTPPTSCGYVGFAPTTQTSSGTVDLLAILKWVIDNHPEMFGCTTSAQCKPGGSRPAELSTVEYGVEISYTNGTQKFELNNFSLSCAPVSCAQSY